MKKWLAFLMALLMVFSQTSVLAEGITDAQYEHLVVGNTTAFNGNFSTNMWGNNTADLDVEEILFGYNLIFWQYDQGYFDVDPMVVTGILVYDDEQGNRTYQLALANDLYYSDGTPITAKDYAFSILLSVADEVKALDGNTDNYTTVLGMNAYKNGEAETLAGVRVMGDHMLAITVAAEYLPFFYELGMLRCLPLPIHVIAPGCEVKDDGQGVYLDKSAGTFTVEALRESILNPETGYLYHPMVTCGPYKLVSFTGDAVEFEINEYYKGDAEGYVPTIPYITYKTVSNETMMEELANGELGLINKVVNADSIMQGIALMGEGAARMSSYARIGYSFVSFNCEKPTVAEQAVRQAMAYCMDKDTLVQSYVGDFGLRVDGYYGIGQWMYQILTGAIIPEVEEPAAGASAEEKQKYEDTLKGWEELNMDSIPVYNLDLDKANSLLDEAGWTLNKEGKAYRPGEDDVRCKEINGELVALDLEMIYPEGNTIVTDMQTTFVDHLLQVGIVVKMTPVPMADLLIQYYRQEARDCDMIYLATNFSEVFDPTLTYAPVDGINSNFTHLEDEKLYQLAQDMIKTEPGDVLTYCQKWVAFQEYWAEVLPTLPVYSNAYFDFYTPYLQGYEILPSATWSQAIVKTYLGDPAEEIEEEMEEDFGDSGIIIIE